SDPLYRRHRFPPEVISYAVWLYFRFPLSLRMVEEMLAERGICVTYETVRRWGKKFGKAFSDQIRKRAPARGDKWHMDEVVVSIAGEQHWLWRAVGTAWAAQETACLDGAPSSRVWLRLCERFGCGHVFGLLARETNVPLALMLVRMALRPISKTRSLWRLPFSSGFRADPLVPMSGRRPVVKGLVEALRTLRVRSCLRPVGAGNECPAGPDVGPHGSSP